MSARIVSRPLGNEAELFESLLDHVDKARLFDLACQPLLVGRRKEVDLPDGVEIQTHRIHCDIVLHDR